MQSEHERATALLQKFRSSIQSIIPQYQGEVINFYGDGVLCIFDNLNPIVEAAIALQYDFQKMPSVPVRIGLHCGEVFFEDDNAFGTAINITSRIESVGIAGTITLSKEINVELKSEQKFNTVSLGVFDFKNVKEKREVFAIKKEGIIIPSKKEIKGKIKEKKNNSIPIILGSLLFVGALLFSYFQFFASDSNLENDRSLAIIPLENLSQDISQNYFSDGISQDILTHLSGIKDLQIISFNSSKKYRDTDLSAKEIGKELGVKHLVFGSIQQAGEKIRIRARLINTNTEEQLWAENFDRDINDIFAIQSEVSQKIANVLKTKLTPSVAKRINQSPTQNLEAYQLYSQGRYQWGLRTKESLLKAADFFNQAIQLDTSFALAYSGLAQSYSTLGASSHILPSIAFPKAINYAEKALAIDPNQGSAYTVLGSYYYDHDFQFDKSLGYFQKAIEVNPNDATTRQWLAEAYFSKGDIVNARKQINIANRLDPSSIAVRIVTAYICLGESNINESINICNELLKIYPGNSAIENSRLYFYYESNQMEKAVKDLTQRDPNFKYKEHWIELYSRLGEYDKLREFRNNINSVEDESLRKWYNDLIDFKLLIEQEDYETYAAKIDTFLFIERNRNLFGQQAFPASKEVREHPRYQRMMKERGFQLIKRNFKNVLTSN